MYMRQVFLLKAYDGKQAGTVIELSNNVAFGLVDSGVARYAETRDFLVKPEFGVSKSFKKAPSSVKKEKS